MTDKKVLKTLSVEWSAKRHPSAIASVGAGTAGRLSLKATGLLAKQRHPLTADTIAKKPPRKPSICSGPVSVGGAPPDTTPSDAADREWSLLFPL
jgi:hypothetical protein